MVKITTTKKKGHSKRSKKPPNISRSWTFGSQHPGFCTFWSCSLFTGCKHYSHLVSGSEVRSVRLDKHKLPLKNGSTARLQTLSCLHSSPTFLCKSQMSFFLSPVSFLPHLPISLSHLMQTKPTHWGTYICGAVKTSIRMGVRPKGLSQEHVGWWGESNLNGVLSSDGSAHSHGKSYHHTNPLWHMGLSRERRFSRKRVKVLKMSCSSTEMRAG